MQRLHLSSACVHHLQSVYIIEGLNIPVYQVSKYEADDIIGTLAKKAEREGFKTYMMTSDKDYGQLVSENIFVYRPGRFGNEADVLGVKEVCEKYGIERVEQLIDILGMMGDAVDNIPGIPGIGEKTATKLVQEYGSVEGLLANVDKLKGKQKENVENNKEVYDLLKGISLEQFYDKFINEGFDDRQSLMELGTDDLNRMRMKASHQRALLSEIQRKVGSSTSVGPDFDDSEICRSYISSRNRIHTEPQLPGNR